MAGMWRSRAAPSWGEATKLCFAPMSRPSTFFERRGLSVIVREGGRSSNPGHLDSISKAAAYWIPRFRVWSREIGERFERSDITQAFEAGPIVISHEAVEEGITVGVAREGAAGDAAFGFSAAAPGHPRS